MTKAKESPQADSESARGAQHNARLKNTFSDECNQGALAFLERHSEGWLPEWYVQLCTFEPAIAAIAVPVTEIGRLATFIEKYQGQNLYFAVNPLRRDPGKKCNKGDMAALAYVHADMDPPKAKLTADQLAAEKRRMQAAVEALQVPASTLIDTGNGLAAYWRMEQPIAHDGNTDALESMNRRMAHALGADTGTIDLSRVMRLPFTTNYPVGTKLELERPVSPTKLLYQNENAYAPADFDFLPPVAPKIQAVMPPTGIGTPLRLDDYGLPPDQAALVAGTSPKGQRSEVMHGLLRGLLDDGHSRDDVLATVHAEPGLRDYCTSKHPGDPEAFALAELENAWRETSAGITARLLSFGPVFAERFGAAPPFKEATLVGAIRFDAAPTTLAELDADDPPIEYVIEPIFPLATPGEFAGAHGIGKSINGLTQCCCVAAGLPWQGLPTMQGKAVFASWEDSRRMIMRRVKTWLRNIKDPLERAKAKRAIADNLITLGCDEIDLMLTTKAFTACSVRDDVIELIAERCQGAIFIMLETAALMHGGDELNEDLAQLAKAVKLITNRTGAAVVTIRHVSKDAARSRIVDAYVGRGGGSFTGAMRSMAVLVDVSEEDVRKKCIGHGNAAVIMGRPVLAYHHAKANYGEKMKEPIYLVVMSDGHMEHITGPNAKQAHSDRLLEWLRENMEEGGLSFTKIRNASKKHGVKQDLVRVMLGMLEGQKHIKRVTAPSRGARGEAEMWQLVELV